MKVMADIEGIHFNYFTKKDEVRHRLVQDIIRAYEDLQARRAEVQSLFADSPVKEIHGEVPVAEMFSYSTTLRSLTQGRGTFHTGHVRYAPVPKSLADEVRRNTLAHRKGEGQAA